MKKTLIEVKDTQKEKVILVALQKPNQDFRETENSLDELKQLSLTAGAKVVKEVIQNREKIESKTYIGTGKAEEIRNIVKSSGVNTVIFNNDLTPTQQGNLEGLIDSKVIDRTALILDIFAQRAHSGEGKLQVELAQLNYRLPRLKGKGVELSRLGGGIGTRGPGETKLEVDRRRINRRIGQLKKELVEIDKSRSLQRKQRKKTNVFNISLVGYTNVGKSTLLNTLTGAEVFVQDKLFATLDSTSRKLTLSDKRETIVSDTVGFIKDLPHQLIASFKSTLDEVREADLIIHVVDASHLGLEDQIISVEKILEEIGVSDKLQITVFNKADKVDEIKFRRLRRIFPDAIFVSALKNEGVEDLLRVVNEMASNETIKTTLEVPYDKGVVIQKAYNLGKVISEKHVLLGTILEVEIPKIYLSDFKSFFKKDKK
ncbi:MAG TPA: GTPase HflX [Actinobacteria bacterium]|nr:GTPase HflX [Actinomycetota bacterium]